MEALSSLSNFIGSLDTPTLNIVEELASQAFTQTFATSEDSHPLDSVFKRVSVNLTPEVDSRQFEATARAFLTLAPSVYRNFFSIDRQTDATIQRTVFPDRQQWSVSTPSVCGNPQETIATIAASTQKDRYSQDVELLKGTRKRIFLQRLSDKGSYLTADWKEKYQTPNAIIEAGIKDGAVEWSNGTVVSSCVDDNLSTSMMIQNKTDKPLEMALLRWTLADGQMALTVGKNGKNITLVPMGQKELKMNLETISDSNRKLEGLIFFGEPGALSREFLRSLVDKIDNPEKPLAPVPGNKQWGFMNFSFERDDLSLD